MQINALPIALHPEDLAEARAENDKIRAQFFHCVRYVPVIMEFPTMMGTDTTWVGFFDGRYYRGLRRMKFHYDRYVDT